MSTTTEERRLELACEEWRRLAEAERDAILSRDWTRLAVSQDALQTLQHEVSLCLARLREQSPGSDVRCLTPVGTLRASFGQIIKLERENGALLAEAQNEGQARFDQFSLTSRTLGRLRASYAPAAVPTWSSFS